MVSSLVDVGLSMKTSLSSLHTVPSPHTLCSSSPWPPVASSTYTKGNLHVSLLLQLHRRCTVHLRSLTLPLCVSCSLGVAVGAPTAGRGLTCTTGCALGWCFDCSTS